MSKNIKEAIHNIKRQVNLKWLAITIAGTFTICYSLVYLYMKWQHEMWRFMISLIEQASDAPPYISAMIWALAATTLIIMVILLDLIFHAFYPDSP